MRTRLAPLIIVKQEPLSNDYLDSENDINNINYNDVDAHFYGHHHHHHHERRDHLQDIGDLNNNQEFNEDKKCMYFDLVYLFHFTFMLFVIFIGFILSFTYYISLFYIPFVDYIFFVNFNVFSPVLFDIFYDVAFIFTIKLPQLLQLYAKFVSNI